MVTTKNLVNFIISIQGFFILTFDSAISSLKQGEFVMIHDSNGRENEIDLVVAAQFITPEHIARMRQHAGGLICLAIDDVLATKSKFLSSFKTPGHVPILLASQGLLARRKGHTEMSIYLAQLAKLSPITAICEMMDGQTYSALSVEKAEQYAKDNAIPFIDGKELLEFAKVH